MDELSLKDIEFDLNVVHNNKSYYEQFKLDFIDLREEINTMRD